MNKTFNNQITAPKVMLITTMMTFNWIMLMTKLNLNRAGQNDSHERSDGAMLLSRQSLRSAI